MDKKNVITSFVKNRPESLGAYGYGSGVFRQSGYGIKDDPQIDLIFLVEDLKDWHLENMRVNKDDYSLLGKLYVNVSSLKRLKGRNRITYYSQIYENGYRFKYGVMEEEDFLSFLDSWDNFFIAGRFQKPVLQIKGTEKEEEAIKKNKRQALLVAALMSPAKLSKVDFYKILCSLSYNGTLRMYVAENPHKVDNIVTGSYDRLNELYDLDVDFIKELDNDMIEIDHMMAIRHIKELPIGLLKYLYENNCDFLNIISIREGINNYLSIHNKIEEINQTIDSIKTNGIVRSAPYLLAKVKKRVMGK